MPAKLRMVTLWTDLQAAGGTCVGAIGRWSSLRTSYRNDGDDRVSGTIPRTEAGVSSIVQGSVLRFERADDSVEEWIVQVVRDPFGPDEVQVEALGARVWLADRVAIRDGNDFALAGSGTLSEVLTALLATDEWPSWVIAGTISRDVEITYSWDKANGLTALLAMVASANATADVALANETVRLVLERFSNSQYKAHLLTTATTGDPILAERKNISAFAVRDSRVQTFGRVVPLGSDGSGIGEAYFHVRNFSAGPKTLELRDAAYRDDRLGVSYDGQWTGYYLIAPDGSANLITDSDSATQEVTLSTTTGVGTDDYARISPDSGGGTLVDVVDNSVDSPRTGYYEADFAPKINWLVNGRFDEWVSSSNITSWTESGWTVTQESGAGNVETGPYSVRLVGNAGTMDLQMNLIRWPDEIIDNGGTTTWRVGIRVKRYVGAFGNFNVQYTKNSGSTWTTLFSVTTTSTSWITQEATFTTAAADTGQTMSIRLNTGSANGHGWYVDRLWMFRDGVDTGDDTINGSGAARLLYEGNRYLLANRTGGTTYEVGVIDRYRDDPTGYPDDKLAVNQEVRLLVPSRSVDTTVTLAGLEVDELRPLSTTAQVGSLRRRLTVNL